MNTKFPPNSYYKTKNNFMKKIIFFTFLLLGSFCFSQSITKKYNSYSKQYEYFDSYGSMIAYEKYNSYSNQWEYYDLKSTQSQPYQYREPAKVDMSSTINAASVLQNRYDNNVQKLQSAITTISNQINNLDVDDEQKQVISNNFQKQVDELNKKNINYSSANETNRVIQWLYDSLNIFIKNATSSYSSSNSSNNSYSRTSETNNKPLKYEDFFNRTLNVYRIAIYHPSTYKFSPDEKIINNSYIVLKDNTILFRRADGTEYSRDLTNKRYNSMNQGYDYSSNYGAVFISENLTYVQFFDNYEPKGDSYTYFISK